MVCHSTLVTGDFFGAENAEHAEKLATKPSTFAEASIFPEATMDKSAGLTSFVPPIGYGKQAPTRRKIRHE